MKSKECNRFDSCSATICPLDETIKKCSIWYPDEEICQSQVFCHEPWIKNQKKIAGKCRNTYSYFTLGMLKHDCIIGKGIEGLEPDHELNCGKRDEDKWLQEHPEKRTISEEKRKELRNRLLITRQRLIPPIKDSNGRGNTSQNKQSA